MLLRARYLILVVLAEHFVALVTAGVVATLLHPDHPTVSPAGWVDYLALLTALGVLGWWIAAVLKPSHQLLVEEGEEAPSPEGLPSTHPVYLLYDAALAPTAWLLHALVPWQSSAWAWEITRSRGVWAALLLFPLLRLAGWYWLRRRPGSHPWPQTVRASLLIAAALYVPLGLLLGTTAYSVFIAPRRGVPLITAQALGTEGEVPPGWLDPARTSQPASDERELPGPVTRILRLEGAIAEGELVTCGPWGPRGDDFRFAAARLDVGPAEVVAYGRGAYAYDLARAGKSPRAVLYGRLRPWPSNLGGAEWCGLGNLPPAKARYLFVLENP